MIYHIWRDQVTHHVICLFVYIPVVQIIVRQRRWSTLMSALFHSRNNDVMWAWNRLWRVAVLTGLSFIHGEPEDKTAVVF